VSGIEYLDLRAWYFFAVAFGLAKFEGEIVLAP
jgi:hypothetical protein